MSRTTTLAPIVPDVDLESLVDGAALGDDILLSAAGAEKTKRVHSSGRTAGAVQSHSARAWTFGGQVD